MPVPGKETSANADGVFEPFQMDAVPWKEFVRGQRFGLRYQHLRGRVEVKLTGEGYGRSATMGYWEGVDD
jgi:hypothetical protein